MTVFALSPNYLRAIFTSHKGYTFDLQGYGTVKNAVAGLKKTNKKFIDGFVILANTLDDIPDLDIFLDKIKLMFDEGKSALVVFGLRDSTGLEGIVQKLKNYANVYLHTFEILTDLDIKRSLFGTILKHTREILTLSEEVIEVPKAQLKSLATPLPYPTSIIKVLSYVKVRGTLERTTIEDDELRILESTEGLDPALVMLRKEVIVRRFGVEDTMLFNKVDKSIEEHPMSEFRLLLEMLRDMVRE